MPRFRFPLEQALRYKERRERLAEIRQMQAAGRKRACDLDVQQLEREIESNAKRLEDQMHGPVESSAWMAVFQRSEQLGKELRLALERRTQAEKVMQETMAAYQRAVQEAESLRTLRSRRHEEHRDQETKTEQVRIEEQTLRRWRTDDNA
ncbi:MAG: hypothetical protein U0793_13340 [Gemmataceae bacterium]